MRWLALAAVLGLVRLVAPRIPVGTYDLGQAHAVCGSVFGQVAVMLSQSAAVNCGHVAAAYDALNVVAVAAVGCLVLFGVSLMRRGAV